MYYNKTLLLTEKELEERRDTESLQELDRVVVLIKPGVDEEAVLNKVQEKYGFSLEDTLLSEGVHGDDIYLFAKE